MISVRPAGQLSVGSGENFNVAIFSDTIIVINVKFYMMVLSLNYTCSHHFLYGHSSVKLLTEKFMFFSDKSN